MYPEPAWFFLNSGPLEPYTRGCQGSSIHVIQSIHETLTFFIVGVPTRRVCSKPLNSSLVFSCQLAQQTMAERLAD
jgi:hypothetical protein